MRLATSDVALAKHEMALLMKPCTQPSRLMEHEKHWQAKHMRVSLWEEAVVSALFAGKSSLGP